MFGNNDKSITQHIKYFVSINRVINNWARNRLAIIDCSDMFGTQLKFLHANISTVNGTPMEYTYYIEGSFYLAYDHDNRHLFHIIANTHA